VLVLAVVLVVAMVCGIREVWAISRDLAVAVGIMAALYLLLLVDAWRCAAPGRGRDRL